MEIYNDDCLKVLEKLKEDSIDMILVDLPYGQTACKWDCLIDLDKMWKLLKKCCKGNAVMVFFCTTKFGNTLINSNKKGFKYDLVWEKSRKVGFLSANKMPLRKHEMIYVFKGDKPDSTYNSQKTTGHKTRFIKPQLYKNNNKDVYGMKGVNAKYVDDTRHPHSILKFNNANHSGGTLHRTQKPVDLCEWLIKSYTKEGEVVCDFTMGSGTTGIACLNTNRKFIGVELDKEIFKLAKDRIDNHKKKEVKEEVKEEVKKEGLTCSCGKVLKKINKRHLESPYHIKNSSK
jgi:DNA modification methylase